MPITVADKNGDEVELPERNGKYTFIMPASKVTVKTIFKEDASMLNSLVDVPADAYYADAVLWAVESGITKGTSYIAFSPDAECIRAQITTFLWRSQSFPAVDTTNPFTAVAADAYYSSAVLWATVIGIITGTTATAFSPNGPCTRAQIVTFLIGL